MSDAIDVNATNRATAPRCPHCNGPAWIVAWAERAKKTRSNYCFNECPKSIKEHAR